MLRCHRYFDIVTLTDGNYAKFITKTKKYQLISELNIESLRNKNQVYKNIRFSRNDGAIMIHAATFLLIYLK